MGSEEIIRLRNLSFGYNQSPSGAKALKGVNLSIYPGELLAILGSNGSGKSTLVKHLNGLIPLESGEGVVAGIDLSSKEDLWELRRRCAMVFQNPDNQFVSNLVLEDIAFGLENYGVARREIDLKVREALAAVGMDDYLERSTSSLSGGQKQLVALAGVLALSPEIIIYDEVTSMLDPRGSLQVLEIIKKLRDEKKTQIMISHRIEEALLADRVLVMKKGQILAHAGASEILGDRELLESAGLELPFTLEVYQGLLDKGIRLDKLPLDESMLVDELCCLN